jgi:hypothetical protein
MLKDYNWSSGSAGPSQRGRKRGGFQTCSLPNKYIIQEIKLSLQPPPVNLICLRKSNMGAEQFRVDAQYVSNRWVYKTRKEKPQPTYTSISP